MPLSKDCLSAIACHAVHTNNNHSVASIRRSRQQISSSKSRSFRAAEAFGRDVTLHV